MDLHPRRHGPPAGPFGEVSLRCLRGPVPQHVDAIQPTNKRAKVTNSTAGGGRRRRVAQRQEATAIVFTNTTSTTPLSKNIPSIRVPVVSTELKQDRGNWLVTKMTTITSLDLTPKL